MSIPSFVPVFDLEMFLDYSWEQGFQIEILASDGTSQVPPVFENLTGKTVVLVISEVFGVDFTLTSDDPVNAHGSQLTIDADPTTGTFLVQLGEAEMLPSRIRQGVGYYRVVIQQTGVPDRVIFRGTVRIIPFTSGGEA